MKNSDIIDKKLNITFNVNIKVKNVWIKKSLQKKTYPVNIMLDLK